MEKGLIEKTGKDLKHWIKIVKKSKIEKHSEIIKFLKSEHDFTHGFANFVSLKARESDAGSIEDKTLLDTQYSKGKEELRPLFELIESKIKKFGSDIEIVPKKANVSFKTKKQFALVQPSTKTRIDVGLKLKDFPVKGRLKDSGSFGTMCTHRIEVTTKKDIDKELLDYLKKAYEMSK
ncbi:MAG: DUF4287 domain-containing protein [Calditrichaeota bacterium]|nr:MAG: DUF4287 domain-containing protein [Calditrichota bacterium]